MHTTTVAHKDVIAGLVGKYITTDGKVNPWFKRKLDEQPLEVRDEVLRQIREQKLDERRTQIHTQFKVNIDTGTTKQESQGTRISWSDAEWDQLADLVWRARKKNPIPPIGKLVKKAIAQFPADRKRNLSSNSIAPLLERLAKKDEILFHALDELSKIKAKLGTSGQIQTKDEVLADLTDDEVLQHFKNRVLTLLTDEDTLHHFKSKIIGLLSDEEVLKHFKKKVLDQIPEEDMIERYQSVVLDYLSPAEIVDQFEAEDILACLPTSSIVGYVVKQFVERFEGRWSPLESLGALLPSEPPTHTKLTPHKPTIPVVRTVAPPQKKKITIIGMLPKQVQITRNRLDKVADLNFVDKNYKTAINNSCDIIVLWGSFASHAAQIQAQKKKSQSGCKMITHHGGVLKLIEKLESEIA